MRQRVLSFKVEWVDRPETCTAHAGLLLFVELCIATIPARRLKALRDALGYQSVKPVRRHLFTILALIASGGEHLSDVETLRGDPGFATLSGMTPSCATLLKTFLYLFHQSEDGSPLTPEEDSRLSRQGKAQIRPEGPGLQALDMLSQSVTRIIWQALRRPRRATLDVDASIIESHKRQALYSYKGVRGYQPQMAWWAELGIWLADQFRDGNVPAEFDAVAFLRRSFERLPREVTDRRLRADSAFYNEDALSWADAQGISFAVSADMSQALEAAVQGVPEACWRPYRGWRDEQECHEERQWAEVADFVPGWARNRKKHGRPFRYIAIRVRSRQRELFPDDSGGWRHFAVVTNMDWQGERLLRWHREKQGTVEFGHSVVKNDLGGGVLPAGRFGANAAWWRMNLLTHNLLVLLRNGALPERLSTARPKGLRFHLFHMAARVVRHARNWVLKLWRSHPMAEPFVRARQWIARLHQEVRSNPPILGTG